ncbi:zeatin O-glucosyltransferase [Capsicum annuum]|uniref:zeatin O-glucosyltransferase n=1 Tax=Capsicum annuum TaxID=4072 RepID=UPI001FB05E72|nr:zeatin O-glucosyltransferase [Capsicum annuum]
MATTNSSDNEVIVSIVPFPDYSHLNNLFDLARFIASHNIPVYFLSVADMNQDLKLRVHGGLRASNIHFEDLLVKDDDPAGRDPILMFLKKLREPVLKTCLELTTNAKRLVVIHDNIMTEHIWEVNTFPNVMSYIFHVGSAFNRYYLLQQSIPDIVDDDHVKLVEQMHDELLLLEPHVKLMVRMEHELEFHSGEVINSCKEVEGKYTDLLAKEKRKPSWVFGPFHMLVESHNSISSSSSNMTRHECLEFLDKQDASSVIFVSFGSTTTLSQEQVNELALGLEQSNHRFIWVLRKGSNDKEKLREKDGKIELPEGFEKRVEGRGMLINWAPQLEILRHSSTGGFLSHCGWSSCIESISMGVPLATWPINYDQPSNAVYVTNVLKIGISVKSWAHREELVTASTIEKAVKTLMGTTEGEEMRQRAVELSKKIKSSVSDGGPARKEMESFISIIIK